MKDKDIKHLEWVYERMKYVHNENDNYDYMIRFRDILESLRQPPVSGLLSSKDEAINVGFRKATVEGYNYRRVCREPDHDIYYSGWMDCYDWLSGNYR